MKKKLLAALMALVLIVGFVTACAGETPAPETPAPAAETPAPAPAPAEEPAPAPVVPEVEPPAHATGEPIVFGHMAYHTGGFGFHGSRFDASVNLAIAEANQDPPLGRPIRTALHVDVGTLGEAETARRLLIADNVDILYNIAGQYGTFNEFFLEYVAAHDAPIAPTIHGGAVPAIYGGTPKEPIMRGEPHTADQAIGMVCDAFDKGARSIVIIASDREEMMMQRAYSMELAEILGMEVLDVIVIQPGAASYRAEAAQVVAADPDAIIQFSHSADTGNFLKNAAELGLAGKLWYGETNSGFTPFFKAAGADAIEAQEFVGWPSIAVAENPAWEHFQAIWNDYWGGSILADNPARNYYVTGSWDILMMTFLAIEKGGSVNASVWVPTMYEIAAPGGVVVYTYLDGIRELRAGNDIQYVGVTGEIDFSDTGSLLIDIQIGTWNLDGTPSYENMSTISRDRIADLFKQFKTEWSWD